MSLLSACWELTDKVGATGWTRVRLWWAYVQLFAGLRLLLWLYGPRDDKEPTP